MCGVILKQVRHFGSLIPLTGASHDEKDERKVGLKVFMPTYISLGFITGTRIFHLCLEVIVGIDLIKGIFPFAHHTVKLLL